MVLLAAAAVTAAGVGAYKGGKAVAADVGKKVRRRQAGKLRRAERQVEADEREKARQQEAVRTENMTAKERVERFKKSIPSQSKKGGGLFRKS